MAQYTAASAAINLFPKAAGFHSKAARLTQGLTAQVRVTPDFAGFRAPSIAPIPVNVQPNIDNAALARIEQALRALPKIELDANSAPAQQKVAELRARLETLRDKVVNLQVSDTQARAEIALIQRDLDSVDRMNPSIDVAVDAGAASAALSRVDSEASRLSGKTARIGVDVDIGAALAGLTSLAATLVTVNGMSVRPHIDVDVSGAISSIARLIAMVGTLGGLGGAVGGLAGAIGGIGAASAVAGAGLGATVLATLGVGKALSAMSAQQDSAGATAKQAAQQQAQAAQQVESANSRLAQAAQKAGQARSDAARDVTRAESESASQIQQAQTSLSRAATAAGKARADAARSVAQAEAAAERSVTSARDQAARSIASAVTQQNAAYRRLRQATAELRVTQGQLTSAWEAGRRSLQDLQDQVDGNALDQRQAALDLKDARKALDEARASGDGEAIARAQLAYDRQIETIDQLGKQTQRLGQDNQKAQLAGVAGTDEYRAALDRVKAAQDQSSEAAQAAATATAATSQARVDGAATVAQAESDGAARVTEARRAGQEQIAAADQRASDAKAALDDAATKGAQRVADAREQGARQVAAADQQVIEAQKALTQALAQTGTAGESAADKVAAAFANLSPAAAAFARYLFSLKPILEGLSATAATAFFPPLTAGIQALVAQLPIINTVVGQLAGAMGTALGGMLTELANPFWMGFFQMLGNAAATVIPGLFGALMSIARAAATLITALMPLAPAGFAIVEQISALIVSLTPFLVQLLGGLIPAASAFLSALTPLGPVLGALQPILLVLGQAFAQVLGAVLTALAPILVALTPMIQVLAESLAGQLVASIQALTPFLVGLATWMSANPQLVMTLVGAVLSAIPVFNALGAVFSFLFGPIALLRLGMMLFGGSLTGVLAPLGVVGAKVGSFLGLVTKAFSPLGVLSTIMKGLGSAVMSLGRMFLTALGPVGWLILIFGTLYATSAPFRDAINQILGVLMQLVTQIISAVMPIFTALSGVLQMVAGVFSMLVGQLAAALIPVINMVAGVLMQLVSAVLPPLVGIINALLPVITMLGGVFVQLVTAALGPVIDAVMQVVSAVLPPLVAILQNVVIPIVTILAGLFADYLAFVISNVLVPAIQFLVPIITWLANLLATVLTWAITNVVVPALGLLVPMFQFIGTAAQWLWTNVLQPAWAAIKVAWDALIAGMSWAWTNILKPVFDAIGFIARVLIAIILTVLITPLMIAWNLLMAAMEWAWNNILKPVWEAIQAAAGWLWTNVLMPIFSAIGAAWGALMDGINWVWLNVLKPVWDAIIAALNWLYINVWQPIMAGLKLEWQMLMDGINWVWLNILKPVWDAIIAALNWLYINVWQPIMDGLKQRWQMFADAINWVWLNVIKPAWDAVAGGLTWLKDRFMEGVDRIGQLWAGLKAMLAKPINFMIDTVWNRGVVPAWNAVAGLVGLGEIKPLGLIPEAATGGRVDTAGKIHGPGTGTSDSIMARVPETDSLLKVSNREFIMNAQATRRNLPLLTAMNGGAEIGGPRKRNGGIPGLAGGGPVSWQELQGTIMGAFPNARITDTVRPGAHDMHGAGKAIDIGGTPAGDKPSMLRINQWIAQHFGGSAELIHTQPGAVNIKNGKGHQYSRALQEQHRDHVHWANNGGKPGGFKGWISGVGDAISTYFHDEVAKAFDSVTNPAIDKLRGFVGPPPPRWREAVPALAVKARDTVRDFVFGKADAKDAEASSGGGGMMGPIGDGEKFVIGQIADSARAHGVGFDGGVIGVATGIVESGLRNLNYGDRDSVGVFQQRGNGAWGSLEQRMNVRHAADMFYNQLVSFDWRRMAPGDAAQKVQRSGVPDAYGKRINEARGLLTQHGGKFDSGGLAFGKGVMFKDVMTPERVLDPVQTRDYDTLTRATRALDVGRAAASSVGDDAAWPESMRITSGRLEFDPDGFMELVDGRVEAVGSQLRNGRRT